MNAVKLFVVASIALCISAAVGGWITYEYTEPRIREDAYNNGYNTGWSQADNYWSIELEQVERESYRDGYTNGMAEGKEMMKTKMEHERRIQMYRERKIRKEFINRSDRDYMEIDGYDIYIKPFTSPYKDNWTGYTTMNNDLYVRTQQTVYSTYTTCVHEKLHNLYPNREHEWIYRNQDERVDGTCLKMLRNLPPQ